MLIVALVSPTKPIPIRLPNDLIPRIDAVAAEMGLKRAQLIVLCVRTFVERVESGVEIRLPIEWETMLPSLDGRRAGTKPERPDH